MNAFRGNFSSVMLEEKLIIAILVPLAFSCQLSMHICQRHERHMYSKSIQSLSYILKHTHTCIKQLIQKSLPMQHHPLWWLVAHWPWILNISGGSLNSSVPFGACAVFTHICMRVITLYYVAATYHSAQVRCTDHVIESTVAVSLCIMLQFHFSVPMYML